MLYLWNNLLAKSITAPEELAAALNLSAAEFEQIKKTAEKFPIAVSDYFLSLIDKNNPDDPIKKQVVPDLREICLHSQLAEADPLAENNNMPVPSLIHRYPDRVVILVSNFCAVNCRHCNRKRNWRAKIEKPNLDKCVDYLKKHKEIREVILSGGDPLLLQTNQLKKILNKIFAVENIKVVRIGSRAPVTFPMRITDELCDMLKNFPAVWLNTQFNHPREITEEAAAACRKIQLAGIPINNQAVLLKGINATPEIIISLCQKLQEINVKPYYLFQCDRVAGTEHFWTPVQTGIDILGKMIGHTGGLCVPRFVIDLPGGEGKIPLMPNPILSENSSGYTFKTYKGKIVDYKKT